MRRALLAMAVVGVVACSAESGEMADPAPSTSSSSSLNCEPAREQRQDALSEAQAMWNRSQELEASEDPDAPLWFNPGRVEMDELEQGIRDQLSLVVTAVETFPDCFTEQQILEAANFERQLRS